MKGLEGETIQDYPAGPSVYSQCPCKRLTDEKGDMKTEAEIEGMWLQVKEYLEPPEVEKEEMNSPL